MTKGAKVDAWMPLWIGDYLADTMHLGAAEHGAYLLLLMHYWRTGTLPDQDSMLCRVARMTTAEWAAARPVIEPFFKVLEGRWFHGRADAERKKAIEGREAQIAKSLKGVEARRAKARGAIPPARAPRPSRTGLSSSPRRHPRSNLGLTWG